MIKFVHALVFQVAGDFHSQFLFPFCDMVELVADKNTPINVVLEIQAWVADVAGMENLLENQLNRWTNTKPLSPSNNFLLELIYFK